MSKKILHIFMLGLLGLIVLFTPSFASARITPNDLYLQKRANFETNLSKISDPNKKQRVLQSDQILKDINQTVCARFQIDIDKLSAILEEEKLRQDVTNTVVAYGQGNTPLDSAAYYVNYAAEALAYQKSQDYTPNISGGNFANAINVSSNNLKSSLNVLQKQILKAKAEVKKTLNYYEK